MDRSIVSPPKSSWFVKFIECLIVVWLVLTASFYNLIAPKGWKVAPIVFSIAIGGDSVVMWLSRVD